MNYVVEACLRCKNTRTIRARGLCRACYRAVTLDGTLKQWPTNQEAKRSTSREGLPENISRTGTWVVRGGVKHFVRHGKNKNSSGHVVQASGRA